MSTNHGWFCPRRRSLVSTLLFITIANPLCALLGQQTAGAEKAQAAPAFYLGINVGVATISAWIHGRAADQSVVRTLAAGVLGGAVMYAGQQIVATRDPTLRLAGIQTVALGANLARNIGSGNPPLSTLVLPVFPFYVQIQAKEPRVRVRVSVSAVMGIAHMRAYGRKLDLGQSLYSGALVFTQDGNQLHCYEWSGGRCTIARVAEHKVGSIAYATDPVPSSQHAVIAHELGHVTQDVRDLILFAQPASDLLLSKSGQIGRTLAKYIVVDLFTPLMAASDMLGPPGFDPACRGLERFYECEVYALIR